MIRILLLVCALLCGVIGCTSRATSTAQTSAPPSPSRENTEAAKPTVAHSTPAADGNQPAIVASADEPKVTASESDSDSPSKTSSSEEHQKTDEVKADGDGVADAPGDIAMKSTAAAAPTWTTQRMVIMGRGGPRFFKLDVNVGGRALELNAQTRMDALASELELNFNEPIEWNALLDKPLVASGWLGNLVPNMDQREQLRGLYDANKDGKVNELEFRAFVTRGLSRSPLLKLSSKPSTAPQLPGTSEWGPIDLDASGELTLEELERTAATMLRYDFDADRIITPQEIRSATDGNMSMTANTRSSFLELEPVHSWDVAKPDAMTRAVLENYSFSDPLASDIFFGWSPQRLKKVDTDGDNAISSSELASLSDSMLDSCLQFTFSDQFAAQPGTLKVNYQSLDPSEKATWLGHPGGGRLTLDGCVVTLLLSDEQSTGVRESFEEQFGRLVKDSQLKTILMQSLELKEGALELLDQAAEKQERPVGDVAWHWLLAGRHSQVQLLWSASESPWFELMDLNGDQKIVAAELEQFVVQAQGWDHNKDGVLQSQERPVSVLLEAKRPEVRAVRSRLGGTAAEKRGTNETSAPTWFTGMDYNSDGELTKGEFLGDDADFEKFDRDRNGVIEAREIYSPQ